MTVYFYLYKRKELRITQITKRRAGGVAQGCATQAKRTRKYVRAAPDIMVKYGGNLKVIQVRS